jgi:hypothetical protein
MPHFDKGAEAAAEEQTAEGSEKQGPEVIVLPKADRPEPIVQQEARPIEAE